MKRISEPQRRGSVATRPANSTLPSGSWIATNAASRCNEAHPDSTPTRTSKSIHPFRFHNAANNASVSAAAPPAKSMLRVAMDPNQTAPPAPTSAKPIPVGRRNRVRELPIALASRPASPPLSPTHRADPRRWRTVPTHHDGQRCELPELGRPLPGSPTPGQWRN